ncbi:MAG: class E sortase [Acidobacteriota bacterium]|nr:class E sortase [Acidobacteriota bacterium]
MHRKGGRGLMVAWLGLLVVVLVAGGYALWMLVGTTQSARNQAARAVANFEASCQTTAGDEATGGAIGVLSFPDLSDATWPIMPGVTPDDLSSGVGWYPQTARPGEIGNMVLTGYRLTNGAPFADLLELSVGDRVRVVSCETVFTYVIEVAPRDLTVQATDDWVLDAVPGEPGRRPTGRMITLVTSQDLLPTSDRSVGFGSLHSTQPR